MKSTSRISFLPFALFLLFVSPLAASTADNSAVQPAQPVTTVAPKYPYLQRRAEAPAEVTVVFTVDAAGKVARADVTRSTNRDFNEATLDAIKRWNFVPAIKDGKPVATRLEQTFVFSVRDLPEFSRTEQVALKKNAR